jgi:hypothetical protein
MKFRFGGGRRKIDEMKILKQLEGGSGEKCLGEKLMGSLGYCGGL